MLTQEQIDHYRENGYLLVPDVLDADTVAELRQVSYDFITRSGASLGKQRAL